MFDKCVECDHILEDEEYLYSGKSYCDDCYKAVKKDLDLILMTEGG